MNIGCCEVAITGLICQIISLGIFAGYNIKWRNKQLELEKQNKELKKEVQEVERINGTERKAIEGLEKRVKELERRKHE